MAYRQNKYKSRRERNATTARNLKLVFWFFLAALTVWLIKNRHDYWAYLKTYFY